MTAPGKAPAATASAMTAATPSKLRPRLASAIASHHRGLERCQPAALDVELHLHTERQGQVLDLARPRGVTGGNTKSNGVRRVAEGVPHDVQRRHSVLRPARLHG